MKTKLSIFIDTSLGHSRKDRHFVKTQKFDNVLIPSTRAEYVAHSYYSAFFVKHASQFRLRVWLFSLELDMTKFLVES